MNIPSHSLGEINMVTLLQFSSGQLGNPPFIFQNLPFLLRQVMFLTRNSIFLVGRKGREGKKKSTSNFRGEGTPRGCFSAS